MEKYRKKLYFLLEPESGGWSFYDCFLLLLIILSLVPLSFKVILRGWMIADILINVLLLIDYLLRWTVADYLLDYGKKSFALYPFRFLSVMDLLALLPGFFAVNSELRLFRIFSLLKTLRVFRLIRLTRYNEKVDLVFATLHKQRETLLMIGLMVLGYIVLSALIVFNVEPDTFGKFGDAVYWSMMSLTTIGYGDIAPVSEAGRIITMISSFVGIAVIALPSCILTAGYMDMLQADSRNRQEQD